MRRFQEVRFERFKAFEDYTVAIREMNVLVGPNNAGKSTILTAFRILSEGMRRARSRKPERVPGPGGTVPGWPVSMASIPVAGENVFYNYDESDPAVVTFKLHGGRVLQLYFPKPNACYLHYKGAVVTGPAQFKKEFPCTVAHVPVLGPVEHDEVLYDRESAREALLNHRASRNFRNIWWHYGDDFDRFRDLIVTTWPGMDIKRPEIGDKHKLRKKLVMFAPEDRIDREIYWSGFGFQVWCQMLTFVLAAEESSLLVIDEPDIYLHSDLQRQLVGILRTLKCDVVLATHSTEIISEVDPSEVVVVNKRHRHGKRMQSVADLPVVFRALGSNARWVLTQLAKTKKAVFVEGGDYDIIGGFARTLGKNAVANRSAFAVVPAGGFRPSGVRDMIKGMEATLGERIIGMAVFDRDYRCEEECRDVMADLKKQCPQSLVHSCKEIENFLLQDGPIDKAIQARLLNRSERMGGKEVKSESARCLLQQVMEPMKVDVQGKYVALGVQYMRSKSPGTDVTTLTVRLLNEFESAWAKDEMRRKLVPGKEVLAGLNRLLEKNCHVTLSSSAILSAFTAAEVPKEVQLLVDELARFASATV